jgi:micrococcal nuclease
MTRLIEYIEQILLLIVAIFSLIFDVPKTEPVRYEGDGTVMTARVIEVIDGDTIDVVIGTSTKTTRVRYIGIDTPEPYAETEPACGSYDASERNKELVDKQIITLVPGTQAYDTYGRLLAYVYVGGTFVNESLVSEGFAKVMMIPPNIIHTKTFMNHYKIARKNKLGIWSTCY